MCLVLQGLFIPSKFGHTDLRRTSLINSAKTSLMGSSWQDKETDKNQTSQKIRTLAILFSAPTQVSTSKSYQKNNSVPTHRSLSGQDHPDRMDPGWICLAVLSIQDVDNPKWCFAVIDQTSSREQLSARGPIKPETLVSIKEHVIMGKESSSLELFLFFLTLFFMTQSDSIFQIHSS